MRRICEDCYELLYGHMWRICKDFYELLYGHTACEGLVRFSMSCCMVTCEGLVNIFMSCCMVTCEGLVRDWTSFSAVTCEGFVSVAVRLHGVSVPYEILKIHAQWTQYFIWCACKDLMCYERLRIKCENVFLYWKILKIFIQSRRSSKNTIKPPIWDAA